ncbi:MAG: S8 family peptidase [Bacteroidota bacterium]
MSKNLFFVYFLLGFSVTANSQTIYPDYVDGEVYLKIDDTTSTQLDINASYFPALASVFTIYNATQVQQPFVNINTTLSHTYRVSISQISNVGAFINALAQIGYVDYAEKVPLFQTSQIPNDFNSNQWYLTKINATQAWDISTGSSAVKIAIVDNAVFTGHEDLINSIYVNSGEIPNNGLDDDFNGYVDDYKGYDAANGDGDVNPPSSSTSNSPWVHGTHCSGIASASTDNGIGIAGLGYNCSIIPVKCTPNSSAGNTLTTAYEGVAYAMNAGADIISMSFGSSGTSLTGQNVISAASLQGITLVAAAGNDNTSNQFFPAAYSEVISVGATDISDQKASFSNFGSTIDVMAPGVGIYSTLSGATNAYGSLSGTSMACPLTAGLCGLIKSQDNTRTPADIKNILQAGCENIDLMNPNFIGQIGAGRINAYNSLSGNILSVENRKMSNVDIAPNPFQESFTIHSAKNSSIRILNSNGQTIESFDSNEMPSKIGFDFPSGFYYVIVSNAESTNTMKVIKL